MPTDRYDKKFFAYIADGSMASARVIAPLLRGWFRIDSVLDVGCGQGAWLKIWREQGVVDVFGIDGEYVDTSSLFIPTDCFKAADLDQPFALERRFDLVSSLEVAEHLPAGAADKFVESLCAQSDHVLFSAAVPGQGGANHINEQAYGYWKEKFESRGFRAIDCIRPAILNDPKVKSWYRYNIFLYVSDDGFASLPEQIRTLALKPGEDPADISPLWYRARKALLRQLSVESVNRLAAINERWTRL